jgi:hypothetical protein
MILEGCVFSYFEMLDWGKPCEILGPKFKPELAEFGRGLLVTWLSCFKTETTCPLKIWFKEKDFASQIFCSNLL